MSDNLKQVNLAIETLSLFREKGEDFSDVRHVVHYFYSGNSVALSAALAELGYSVRPTANNDGVVAERNEAIGESWRTSTLVHLCELADGYGAEYDGWEASLTRQQTGPRIATSFQPTGWLSKILGKKN